MKIDFIDEVNRKVLIVKIMRRAGLSGWLLGFLILGGMSFSAYPLLADDKPSGERNGAAAQTVAGSEAGPQTEPEILDQVSKRISEGKKVSYETQANQLADDLQKIDAEQKKLIQESSAVEGSAARAYDPELILRAKIGLAQRKKELIERKSAFLREKIQTQAAAHAKIQFLLTNVFSDDPSFLIITGQLREMEMRRTLRLAERGRLNNEIDAVSSRIQIEEKYLSAKKVILAAARDNERAHIQETVAIAEERLKVFQELKSLLEARVNDLEFRLTALAEFDRLIRLRRRDVVREKITAQKPYPYGPLETSFALLISTFLAGGLLLRRRFEAAILSLPQYLSRESFLAWVRGLWFLGFVAFFGWGIFNLCGFRAAAIAVGLVYLNIAFGLVLFVTVKVLVEVLFMRLLQKIAKTNQTEIKQSSSVFLLARTALMWLVFCGIFYKLLDYWALRTEVVGWILGVVNAPLFQTEKIKISLWILTRSVLVFWLFYVGSRFLNGMLKARVYPKSSLDKNSQHAIKGVIQFSCLVIGAMAGIQMLGVDLGVLAVFSGTLGIGIGFGLQDIVKNVFSGFVIFFERPIRMGDVVEVGGVPGIVKSIRTRSTIVNTFDNISIVVPNSEFLTNRVVNWSHSDRIVRTESRVGVDYSSDAGLVKETLLEIARTNKKIMLQPAPIVVFEEFADSALLFRLLYWVDVDDRMTVKSEINFAIHSQFKAKGISIPFPQRDLHLKSSDFGLPEQNKGE